MKRKHYSIIMVMLISSILVPVHTKAQKVWTIDSIQALAKANYPQIQQYDLITQARDFNLSNAGKAYLPQFDVTLIGGVISGLPSFTPTPGGESSEASLNMIAVAQLSQTIWDGGITKSRKEITETNAKIQSAEIDVNVHALQQKVSDLYFGLLLINEQIKQLDLLKENLNTNQKRVTAAIQNGVSYKSDLDELNVQLIDADQRLTEFEYTQKAYAQMLSAMIGQPFSPDDSLTKPAPTLFDPSEINRTELSIFQYQRDLVSAKTRMDKSGLYPKFGLLGFATFIQPGIDFGPSSLNQIFVGGLSLSWNINGLYKNKNNKGLRELDLGMIAIQEQTFLYNTRLQTSQTQQQVDKYKFLLEKDQELIELKQSIRNSYEVKYENGIATMSQLLLKINDENVALQTKAVHEIQYLMNLHKLKLETGN